MLYASSTNLEDEEHQNIFTSRDVAGQKLTSRSPGQGSVKGRTAASSAPRSDWSSGSLRPRRGPRARGYQVFHQRSACIRDDR